MKGATNGRRATGGRRVLGLAVLAGLLATVTAGPSVWGGEPTPVSEAGQKVLDAAKAKVAEWAADPVIVSAVKEQNEKGPVAGLDNAKWKAIRRSDPQIKAYQECAAGKFLTGKITEMKGVYTEAFLNGAGGEKVAFVEKTTSYIHKGNPKFDVPFNEGKAWQGKVEFDESTQSYAAQVSVPVLDGEKRIGVLVVGVVLPDAKQ